jgi:hypothetical protein
MSILHGAFIRLPRLSVSLTMTASWYSLICIHSPCFEGFLWEKGCRVCYRFLTGTSGWCRSMAMCVWHLW